MRPAAAALVLALAATPCLADAEAVAALLAGEYNNNEQVWQQGIDGLPPVPRRHWHFRRVGDTRLALAVGIGQSAPGADAWTFAFEDDAPGVVAKAVAGGPCTFVWRATEAGYAGRAQDSGCPGLPAALDVDAEWLTATWSAPGGEREERARRVRHYTGWVALRRNRLDPDAGPDDYVFMERARWHDEGFVLPVLDGDRPTGYAVELARLTYQNTGTAVLKLGIVEEATGETLSYAWADPGAGRVGINLRWIQAGLTKQADRADP